MVTGGRVSTPINMKVFSAVAALVFTSGCYFYSTPPKRPRIKTPAPEPGAEVTLTSEAKSSWSRCWDDLPSCRFENGRWKRWSHWTEVTATYQGQTLTQAEVQLLVDPNYRASWAKIEDKRSTCKISIVPTAIAFLGMAVAAGALFYGKGILGDADRETTTSKAVVYAGSGVFIGAGLLSYPIGGHACISAVHLAHDLEWKNGNETEFDISGDNPRRVRDMERLVKLVAEFNAKARNGGEPSAPAADEPAPDSPPTEAPAETPAEPAEPLADSIWQKLGTDHNEMRRVLGQQHLDRVLKGSKTYTVFAFDNDAYDKLRKPLRESLRGGNKKVSADKLRAFLLGHIVEGTITSEQLTGTRKLTTLAGTQIDIERIGSTLTIGGVTVAEPGIPAANGIVYSIDGALNPP